MNLVCKEGEIFRVDKDLAMNSNLLKNLVSDMDPELDLRVPVETVSSMCMSKCFEYLEKKEENLLKQMSNEELIELILASNYLDISNVLEDSCRVLGLRLNEEPVEKIREVLGIEDV
jgi:S-phase kinase-associated protein 1